jgi:hypothetical protein
MFALLTNTTRVGGYDVRADGQESAAFIGARVVIIAAFWACFFVIACGEGRKWNRLRYLLRSSHAVTVLFYIVLFFIVGMSFPESEAPVSSQLAVAFTTSGFLLWLLADAFRLSRMSRATLTLFVVLRCLVGICFSLFVTTDDPQVADLNGPEVAGTLTKLWLDRMCFLNLALLMSGSLYTLKVDWLEGKLMTVAFGYVLREDVVAMQSVTDLVKGDSWKEFDHNSQLSRASSQVGVD